MYPSSSSSHNSPSILASHPAHNASLSLKIPLQTLLAMQYRYWHKYKRISSSINYHICKQLMVDAGFSFQEYVSKIGVIDGYIMGIIDGINRIDNNNNNTNNTSNRNNTPLNTQQQQLIIQWLTSLLFNIVALNDEYKQQISQSLIESSEQQQHKIYGQNRQNRQNRQNSNSNNSMSMQIIQNLQQIWKQSIPYLLNMRCIRYFIGRSIECINIINNINSNNTNTNTNTNTNSNVSKFNNHQYHKYHHQLQYTLYSTISCLCQKININNNNNNNKQSPKSNKSSNPKQVSQLLQQIAYILQQLSKCACRCSQIQYDGNIIDYINNIVFGLYPTNNNNNNNNTNSRNRNSRLSQQHQYSPHQQQYQQQQYSICKLWDMLHNNYNINLHSISTLIDSNYYYYQQTRAIFNNTIINGNMLIRYIITTIIVPNNNIDGYKGGRYGKNQLFSQQMLEQDRFMQLFVNVLEVRFIGVYAYWIQTIRHAIYNNTTQNNNNTNGVSSISIPKQTYKNICTFLYQLPIQHKQFIDIFRYIYNELQHKCKYSKNVCLDIVKKLLLNRFLLDPSMYYDYYGHVSINGDGINDQVLQGVFNRLRILFYPKKIDKQQKQCKHKDNTSVSVSVVQAQRIQSILLSILTSSSNNNNNNIGKQSQNNIKLSRNSILTKNSRKYNNNQYNNNNNNNKCVIYHLDRQLNRQYQILYNDFIIADKDKDIQRDICMSEKSIQRNNKNNSDNKLGINSNRKSQNTSYQLSFSFVKNNISKINDDYSREEEEDTHRSQNYNVRNMRGYYQKEQDSKKEKQRDIRDIKKDVRDMKKINPQILKKEILQKNSIKNKDADNSSINTVLEHMKQKPNKNYQSNNNISNNNNNNYQTNTNYNTRGGSSQNYLNSPVSQKSRKTVHTQYTNTDNNNNNNLSVDHEMSMIEELVARRRALGTARRAIDQRKNKKRKEREQFNYYFTKIHNDFQIKRRKVQSDANRVRIDIEMV